MKTYNHMAFNVTVPDDWQDDTDPLDRTITLASGDGQDKLHITIMRFADGVTKDQAMTTFKNYLEDCRNGDLKKFGDQVKLTDVTVEDEGNYMFSRYGGFDPEADRRFVTLLTAEKGKLLNFRLETTEGTDDYMNQLASSILETIEVN